MDTIDLSKMFTPEEVKAIVELYRKDGRSRAISEGVRGYWDNLSPEGYKRRCEVNTRRWTKGNERGLAAERSREQWAGYSPERRQEVLGKVFLNEDYRKAFAEARGKMTPEETKVWIDRSFHNPDARKLAIKEMAKGIKRWWAGLSEEQKDKEVLKRVSASAKANAKGPSEPELFLGMYLEGKYPGEWAYNGNGEQNIAIGGRVPDFININGKKTVIEVLGTYHHPEEDEEIKIEHYKKHGYLCIVIWHYDCYLVDVLDGLFGK